MNRIKEAIETIKHKMAVLSLWKSSPQMKQMVSLYRVIMHDTEKLVLILLIGDDLATKLHRKFAGHHKYLNNTNIQDKYIAEAILDWASARITKPNKPLTALQTAKKYYPQQLDNTTKVVNLTKIN